MADGRVTMADGPPAKKPKTASPATAPGLDSSELSMLLTKVNQALPDELASITSSSQLTHPPAPASQNGSDLRAAETILKNRNLSNLLNSDSVPRVAPMAVGGGRYPNMRPQMMQRQFVSNSGLRVGMVQPGGAPMPMYMQIPGTPMHPARGQVVGYPSRHPADVMRAGGGAFDGAGRRFVNPGSPYFINGPDMRSAMMNGAPPFQRPQGGAYPLGPSPVTTFPPGQGQFGMSGYGQSNNPGHGAPAANVFTGMAVPSEAGQTFSPGLAMSIPNNFISSGTFPVSSTTNSGPVVCSRIAVSVSSPAPVASVVSTQLLNGSYVPLSSSLGHKPLTDTDAVPKSSGSVSGPSSLPVSTLNCQRLNMTLPEVTSVSSRPPGSRQLPTPEKDSNIFALDTSLAFGIPTLGPVMGDHLRAAIQSQYVASQLGQLSLASFQVH